MTMFSILSEQGGGTVKNIKSCSVVSFDLDGTLTTRDFADAVWDKGLPSRVSADFKIPENVSRLICRHAYETIGDRSVKYYNLPYWLEYLNIRADARELVKAFSSCIRIFDDVVPALTRIKQKGYRLVIFSNATRLFLDAEIEHTGLEKYFDKIISLPDDWGTLKSCPDSFRKLESVAGSFIHAGDNIHHDYESPQKAGYQAFHIFRGEGKRQEGSLQSLVEFARIVCE